MYAMEVGHELFFSMFGLLLAWPFLCEWFGEKCKAWVRKEERRDVGESGAGWIGAGWIGAGWIEAGWSRLERGFSKIFDTSSRHDSFWTSYATTSRHSDALHFRPIFFCMSTTFRKLISTRFPHVGHLAVYASSVFGTDTAYFLSH